MNTATDPLYSAVQHGLELVALNHVYGPEPKEGIASFQEKRPADWRKFRDGPGARSPADAQRSAPCAPALRAGASRPPSTAGACDADQALALADARGAEHPALWAAAAAAARPGPPGPGSPTRARSSSR